MDQSPARFSRASAYSADIAGADEADRRTVDHYLMVLYCGTGATTAVLRRLGVATAELDDILQDAAIRMLAAARQKVIEAPPAFFARIVTNLLKDYRASGAARMARRTVTLDDADALIDGDDPFRTLSARQEWDICRAHLSSLPALTLRILTMHRLDGDTYCAIAHKLGIPRWQVQDHMRRARALLAAK